MFCPDNDDSSSLKIRVFFFKKRSMLSYCSTSSPGVNPVDGLPPVLDTEAAWAPHGAFGPAPIDDMDPKEMENN